MNDAPSSPMFPAFKGVGRVANVIAGAEAVHALVEKGRQHYHLPLYYLPLSDMSQDASLLQLVSQVPAQSMLLIEDIDIARAATENDDTGKGASLAALLNALDGVFTPHGLITVMTTNHREALDPRLLRPGRIDFEAELGLCTVDQVHALWRLAFGDLRWQSYDIERAAGLSPSQVVGVLQENLNNPERAAVTLDKLGVDHHALRVVRAEA